MILRSEYSIGDFLAIMHDGIVLILHRSIGYTIKVVLGDVNFDNLM